MNILYVANRWDYGDQASGHLSYEHYNFYEPLVRMRHQVVEFDYKQVSNQFGQDEMNRKLEGLVESMRPDLLFACFMYDEVSREGMRRISARGDVKTVLWLCDDHWRWESFSCQWAPCFNWVATTAGDAPAKYEAMGCRNYIKTQWGANSVFFYPGPPRLPPLYDVTFVGRGHGDRHLYLEPLRQAGFNVRVWGPGHGEGRLSQEGTMGMVEVMGRSKINLNFSESAQPGYRQIKGRHFEIPGCGGFQLTNDADNLRDYFEFGKEIGVFEGVEDLVEKVRYYLAHWVEREAIAAAGWRRCVRDHTWEKRFGEIFERMGLGGGGR